VGFFKVDNYPREPRDNTSESIALYYLSNQHLEKAAARDCKLVNYENSWALIQLKTKTQKV